MNNSKEDDSEIDSDIHLESSTYRIQDSKKLNEIAMIIFMLKKHLDIVTFSCTDTYKIKDNNYFFPHNDPKKCIIDIPIPHCIDIIYKTDDSRPNYDINYDIIVDKCKLHKPFFYKIGAGMFQPTTQRIYINCEKDLTLNREEVTVYTKISFLENKLRKVVIDSNKTLYESSDIADPPPIIKYDK